VLEYRDSHLKQLARETIPVAELEEKARTVSDSLPGVSFRDALLLELLHWFKKDFFKWVNKPDCNVCLGKESTMNALGATMPSPEERMCKAGVTEIYGCTLCGSQTRFPRYNDPRKLLTWRQGRCGEWANCFTLCCLALGFEARHVVDWTDHVWTEVFSESQQRWLHCDSCEDKCDVPLLYEAGWGKKLNYILAFSDTHICDVTKRYTRKWEELLTRRTLIPENVLTAHIHSFNQLIAADLPAHLIAGLIERCAKEVEELSGPPPENAQGLEGRISGSQDWKVARGETGPAS
jgi:peptide-N4-(N-acetyl-beta-glucosaminyl)asparagine amidase